MIPIWLLMSVKIALSGKTLDIYVKFQTRGKKKILYNLTRQSLKQQKITSDTPPPTVMYSVVWT